MRTGKISRPQSSGSGGGKSRNCVSTAPTEPASRLEVEAAMRGIFMPARALDKRDERGVSSRAPPRNTPGGHSFPSKETAMAEKKTEKKPEPKRKNGVNVDALLAAR